MFGWGKKEKPVQSSYERVEVAKAVAIAEYTAKVEAVKAARVPRTNSYKEVVETFFGPNLNQWVMNWMIAEVERTYGAAYDAAITKKDDNLRFDDLLELWETQCDPAWPFEGERWFLRKGIDMLNALDAEHRTRAVADFEIKNFAAACGISTAIQSKFVATPDVRGISDGADKADAMFAEGDGYDELFEVVVSNASIHWTADKRPALFDLPASTAVTLEKVLRGFAMSEELRQPSLWHVWARTPHGDKIKDQIRRQVLEQHVEAAQSEEIDALRKQITRLEAAIMAAGIEIPKF